MDDAIDQMNKTAKVIKLFELNRFAYAQPRELAQCLRHRKFLDKSAGKFWVIRYWSGFSVLLHD